MRAVKWIGCTNPVCGQMMEASGHLRALFPDPEHDNSPLRHSNRISVVENTQVLVRPQITSMNRTVEAYIFELQSEWFGFIVDDVVEKGYGPWPHHLTASPRFVAARGGSPEFPTCPDQPQSLPHSSECFW